MSKSKFLIVIGGPTASGKTELSIKLAQHFNTEILSCDSRQFFREMNIGTAKPTKEEQAMAPHHFIDTLSVEEEYSVGDYERDALKVLDRIYQDRNIAIMVGGSGLYQKAVCEGLDFFPEVPTAIRQKIEEEYKEYGLSSLQQRLKEIDLDYYHQVDLQNPHRLIRAISVFEASGQSFSSFRKKQKQHRPFFPIYIEIAWDRKLLYERIDRRVDLMIEKGLLEEARNLFNLRDKPSLQTVGYQELFNYFSGQSSLEEAVELIKRNSRRYAKRQLTWSRRDGFWKHFDHGDWSSILSYLPIAMEKKCHLKKIAVSKSLKEKFPYLDHILEFKSEKEVLAQCHVDEKKLKKYYNFKFHPEFQTSKEVYFFLQEVFHRLHEGDQLIISDLMKPFYLQRGLIALENNILVKK